MKIIFKNLVILLSILMMSSCSNENTEIENKETLPKNSVKVSNKYYSSHETNVVSKIINNKLINFYTFSEFNSASTNKTFDFSEEFRIKNDASNEYIDIVNINKISENIFKFDAITNTGEIVKDMMINLEGDFSNSQLYKNPGIIRAVVVIAAAVIDSLTPSAMEQCANAMNSLNCAEGKSAYMNFSEGWFSTSCSVGCR